MKILIAGIDGYIGWPLALHLARKGHTISGVDYLYRRTWVDEIPSQSILPIAGVDGRCEAFGKELPLHVPLDLHIVDLCDFSSLVTFLAVNPPDVVIHLAEQPSAPWSMMGLFEANKTLGNNILGTSNLLHAMKEICPDAHLIYPSTMGEYGTPGCPIPEGYFPEYAEWVKDYSETWSYDGAKYIGDIEGLPFPRSPGSIYHASKVASATLVAMLCRLWGLRASCLMQGVIYGTRGPEVFDDPALATRFDVDEKFGTALNRFIAQAIIGEPVTLYGAGNQKRGFISLADCCRTFELVLDHAPGPGVYEVYNQIDQVYSIRELAGGVRAVGKTFGIDPRIVNVKNPRKEQEDHIYEVACSKLRDIGYKPKGSLMMDLKGIFTDLLPYKSRIEEVKAQIVPTTKWEPEKR